MQHTFNYDYSSRRVFNIYFSTDHIISNTTKTSELLNHFPIREKSKKHQVLNRLKWKQPSCQGSSVHLFLRPGGRYQKTRNSLGRSAVAGTWWTWWRCKSGLPRWRWNQWKEMVVGWVYSQWVKVLLKKKLWVDHFGCCNFDTWDVKGINTPWLWSQLIDETWTLCRTNNKLMIRTVLSIDWSSWETHSSLWHLASTVCRWAESLLIPLETMVCPKKCPKNRAFGH